MFTMAACRLGYHVAVWDPDPAAPAHCVATHSFPAPFTDPHILERFADLVSVVTYEWENIPAKLCRALEQRKPVRPSSAVLSVIQDRLEQKAFLASNGFPVPPFATLTAPDQLAVTVRQVGYPALCKTATSGYDGKGQWRIKLFKNGGSQAVRLPADCRFPDEHREVSVKRIGRKVILEPLDEWPPNFQACLGAWPNTIDRPNQEDIASQRDPFES
jgi:phosphoribosylaminoimidazole carboxylase (NCAIR synthetase)